MPWSGRALATCEWGALPVQPTTGTPSSSPDGLRWIRPPTTPPKGPTSHALEHQPGPSGWPHLATPRSCCRRAGRPRADRRPRRDRAGAPRLGRLRHRPPVLHRRHRLAGPVGRAALLLHADARHRPACRHPGPRLARGPSGARGQRPRQRRPVLRRQQAALDVVIAPPTFTGPWGLERPLVDGERVEAVGYIGRSHTDEFRPAVFWFDDGRPVNQVLGSELPAQPLEPPYSATDRAATDTRADGPNSSPDATAADAGTSPTVVWARLAVMLLAAVGGSAAYLRARAGRRRTAS